MKATELIEKLETLVVEHGDKTVWHEDNECQGYVLTDVVYDKNDDDFRVC